MPIREYDAFVADWQEEDKAEAYRNANLIATIMNQNPYRKTPVTAAQLLGEESTRKEGDGLAMLRLVIDSATVQKRAKEGKDHGR